MNRRKFVQLSGMGAALFSSGWAQGKMISAEDLLMPGMDASAKKQLADVALNAAKAKALLTPMYGLEDICGNIFSQKKCGLKILSILSLMD